MKYWNDINILLIDFPFILTVALFLSSFFLEKNETKRSSLFSNRFAYKGVHNDRHTSV